MVWWSNCGHDENEDCADILWLVVIVDGGLGGVLVMLLAMPMSVGCVCG